MGNAETGSDDYDHTQSDPSPAQTRRLQESSPANRATTEKTEVLLLRYEQLNHSHYEHSNVIHTTFYLSVVFFAGLLSVVLTAEISEVYLAAIAVFASCLFLILGNWVWRYLRGREEIKKRQRMIEEELGEQDYHLSDDRTIRDTFFYEHSDRVERFKKYFHLSYYTLLFLVSLGVAVAVVI